MGLFLILLIYHNHRTGIPLNRLDNLWVSNYEIAKKKAEIENKAILIYFDRPSNCNKCREMNYQVFQHSAFKSYAIENLVLLRLSFPSYNDFQPRVINTQFSDLGNADLEMDEAGPLILILDKNGNLITKTEYQKGGVTEFLSYIRENISHL